MGDTLNILHSTSSCNTLVSTKTKATSVTLSGVELEQFSDQSITTYWVLNGRDRLVLPVHQAVFPFGIELKF